jgi:hypothetical protein
MNGRKMGKKNDFILEIHIYHNVLVQTILNGFHITRSDKRGGRKLWRQILRMYGP